MCPCPSQIPFRAEWKLFQAKQNSLLIFLPGLSGLCHHPGYGVTSAQRSQGYRHPLLLCPLCSLANHPSSRPGSPGVLPALLPARGVGWGSQSARAWGTYSRGLVEPWQGSPPARRRLRLSVLSVVSPHSLSCGAPEGRNSPKARAAFWGMMPGASSPGPALPGGLLLALAALEGPARHGTGARSAYSSGEEHLHLSAKIINSASEFLTWQQSPRRQGWLLRVPAGTARGGPAALAEGVRQGSSQLAVWARGQLPTHHLSTGPAEYASTWAWPSCHLSRAECGFHQIRGGF